METVALKLNIESFCKKFLILQKIRNFLTINKQRMGKTNRQIPLPICSERPGSETPPGSVDRNARPAYDNSNYLEIHIEKIN